MIVFLSQLWESFLVKVIAGSVGFVLFSLISVWALSWLAVSLPWPELLIHCP